jgi:hypothetical protein
MKVGKLKLGDLIAGEAAGVSVVIGSASFL